MSDIPLEQYTLPPEVIEEIAEHIDNPIYLYCTEGDICYYGYEDGKPVLVLK